MAFPESITIKNAANVDSIFKRMHGNEKSSTYVLATSTLSEPVHLVLQKDIGKSVNGVDRYLLKLQATVLADGVPVLATRNATMANSRRVPRATIDDLLAFEKNFQTSENLTMQLRGEL